MRYRAVLFDLDGTLIDSLADIADAVNRTLAAHRYPIHPVESYRQFVGDGVKKLLERALPPNVRTDAAIVRRCIHDYSVDYGQHWNVKTRLYDGMSQTLDVLKERGLKLAVLSNKPDEFTQACAAQFLAPWRFDIVWGATSRFPHKPDPAGALALARELAISPDHFIYVGDMPVDMQTARNAGMLCVGVSWGLRGADELARAGAQHVIHHPAELLAIAK